MRSIRLSERAASSMLSLWLIEIWMSCICSRDVVLLCSEVVIKMPGQVASCIYI
jgi:hypothetical protein